MIKHSISLLFATTMLFTATPTAASESFATIVNSYLQIQARLAADTADGIKAPARAIAAEATKLGQLGSPIAAAAHAVENAADLKSARTAFGPLSDAVIAAGKAEGWKNVNVRLAYCSMAKKPWLQKEDKIRNPYYGSQMLGCGEFKPLPK